MAKSKLKIDLTPIARFHQAGGDALLQTAQDLFDVSQQLVPVDTGLLKQSGGTDITEIGEGGNPTKVVVGYGTEGSQREDVALFIEYGTSRMSAQPYLTPAFAQAEETFRTRLTQAARKVAEG